jgi:succinylglutamic semialdehyde dehydrogenase
MIIKNPNGNGQHKVITSSEHTINALFSKLKSNAWWHSISVINRYGYLKKFVNRLEENKEEAMHLLSHDTGKPAWESRQEIAAAVQKLESTMISYKYRCDYPHISTPNGTTSTILKPIGLIVVLGPFNFPIHIPNGQILPALLMGNTVIVKSSEYCQNITEFIEKLWSEIFEGTPSPIAYVYGSGEVGETLIKHKGTDAVFFTGSSPTGLKIERSCLMKRIPCALEMGGNNALIIEDLSKSAINQLTLSSFITAGQRCSCARRLFVNRKQAHLIETWVESVKTLPIEVYPNSTSAFMGPVVLESVKNVLLNKKFKYSETMLKSKHIGPGHLITPRIELVKKSTGIAAPSPPDAINPPDPIRIADEEIFGPLVFITLTESIEESVFLANQSSYGLSCSVYCKSKKTFNYALNNVSCGVINWNTPTTGASGMAPFGGVRLSGNHSPGGFLMIDHCYTPIASSQTKKPVNRHLPPNA